LPVFLLQAFKNTKKCENALSQAPVAVFLVARFVVVAVNRLRMVAAAVE